MLRLARRRLRPSVVAIAAGVVLAGAVLGALAGLATPAHVEVAGAEASVWLEPGRHYDQFGVRGLVTLKRATTRSVAGESIGVRAVLALNAAELTTPDGKFDASILPAYIQAFSDPAQIAHDVRWALIKHLLLFGLAGAGIAVGLFVALRAYRRWRRRYDHVHFPQADLRRAVFAYHAPERALARRSLAGIVVVAVVALIPSGSRHATPKATLHPNPIFAGGPLAGVEVDGLLRPAIGAIESSIKEYFSETDAYYGKLRQALVDYLAANPVQLPEGDDVAQFGFVTDRHCNTGMDRVDVAVLQHFGVPTLVSGGDDAFSGTFSFEAACTRSLAEQSAAAGITDVFTGGNHDSAMTMADEQNQGIKTLTGEVVTTDGLHFLGSPDPRSSRYGQGLQPASAAAQSRLLREQVAGIAKTACGQDGPIVAVLHDPTVGFGALQQGCGHVTLALDGHTHEQSGPNPVGLPGGTGYQFTGGSAGGAPNEHAVERTFAARLTVGPLNHTAYVYIVSVHRGTGTLLGVTCFTFSPLQQISVQQQLVPSTP